METSGSQVVHTSEVKGPASETGPVTSFRSRSVGTSTKNFWLNLKRFTSSVSPLPCKIRHPRRVSFRSSTLSRVHQTLTTSQTPPSTSTPRPQLRPPWTILVRHSPGVPPRTSLKIWFSPGLAKTQSVPTDLMSHLTVGHLSSTDPRRRSCVGPSVNPLSPTRSVGTVLPKSLDSSRPLTPGFSRSYGRSSPLDRFLSDSGGHL